MIHRDLYMNALRKWNKFLRSRNDVQQYNNTLGMFENSGEQISLPVSRRCAQPFYSITERRSKNLMKSHAGETGKPPTGPGR